MNRFSVIVTLVALPLAAVAVIYCAHAALYPRPTRLAITSAHGGDLRGPYGQPEIIAVDAPLFARVVPGVNLTYSVERYPRPGGAEGSRDTWVDFATSADGSVNAHVVRDCARRRLISIDAYRAVHTLPVIGNITGAQAADIADDCMFGLQAGLGLGVWHRARVRPRPGRDCWLVYMESRGRTATVRIGKYTGYMESLLISDRRSAHAPIWRPRRTNVREDVASGDSNRQPGYIKVEDANSGQPTGATVSD